MKATNNTQQRRIALAKISQIHQLVRPSVSDYLLQYQTSLMGKAARAFELVRYALLAFLGPLASRDISVLSPTLLKCSPPVSVLGSPFPVLRYCSYLQKGLQGLLLFIRSRSNTGQAAQILLYKGAGALPLKRR